MRILKRLVIRGHTVSILEFHDTIEVECPPELNKDEVLKYLEDEGIMEEALGPDNEKPWDTI